MIILAKKGLKNQFKQVYIVYIKICIVLQSLMLKEIKSYIIGSYII